jgi:hypothetical protein
MRAVFKNRIYSVAEVIKCTPTKAAARATESKTMHNKNSKNFMLATPSGLMKQLAMVSYSGASHKPPCINTLKESGIIACYSVLSLANKKLNTFKTAHGANTVVASSRYSGKEQKTYLKHLVRLRYRWHFRSELGQFKLFRKFFRRSLRRYRKIQKNKLFVNKFRSNFSKLTGFNEKFIYQKWLGSRRNYSQYWGSSNGVLRFSQSLMLSPYSILVLLNIVPSLAASKHVISTGAVAINGATITVFSQFLPGDIMQIQPTALQGSKILFTYQKWLAGSLATRLPYLLVDWSAMLIFLTRWPRRYELLAPSFLSERWVRYYIRLFPSKAAKFKAVRYNTKTYKTVIAAK